MNICCIIVTYNIDNEFSKCFQAIKDQVNKVVIVDNGSDEDTLNYLDKINKEYDIKLIKNKQNMGIAYALNQGVKYAIKNNYDWILTMDDDSQATENMVSIMIDTYNSINADEREKILGIFPTYIEKGLELNKSNDIKSGEKIFHYLSSDMTSGNLVKREAYDIIGLYNEDLFIDYVDHEFCYRIITKGYKLIKLENAILFHRLGNTKEKSFLGKNITYTNHSSLRRYYITRNRFYVWKQFGNLENIQKIDKINFIKENIKILLFETNKIEKIKMSFRGFIDYKKGKYGEFIK